MSQPLVSIIISVYNAGPYLKDALQSILAQTYSNLEIIIIDDGSSDGCMDSIADITDTRICVMTQTNIGKAASLNRALDKISGEFYAIQDADDKSHRSRIEYQVKCMLENPNLAAVFTGHDIILNGRSIAPRFPRKDVQQCNHDIENFYMPAHDPTGLFRVCLVRKFRYDQSLKAGTGLDYILRVGELYPMMVLDKCLYSYRINMNSLTRKSPAFRRQMVRQVYRRAFKRRGFDLPEYSPDNTVKSGKLNHRDFEEGIIPHFLESVLDQKRFGKNINAFKTALACVKLHPLDVYYYKPLIYFLAPQRLIRQYRTVKSGLRRQPLCKIK